MADKYRPIFDLGHGGMAAVYLTVLTGPGGFKKLQVVKKLRRELANDQEFLTMFLDEARLAARINHPNVVQTNEVGFDGRDYFIAMEYLEGQSFEAVLRRAWSQKDVVPMAMQLRILAEALQGLHFAHELKGFDGKPLEVVHRDVSPQNIFVTYEGQVKVVDFGIAKTVDSSYETRIGVLKGKVAYMAPEQIRGLDADRRADIFAVGSEIWRALTGRRLWKGLNEMEIIRHLTGGEIPSPLTINANLPPRLVEICMKALAPEPEDRYQSAAELQLALEGFLEEQGQRVSNRDIGKVVSELFADHRAEVARAIEDRLGEAPTTSSSEIPALSAVTYASSRGSLSSISGTGSVPSFGNPRFPSGPFSRPPASHESAPSHGPSVTPLSASAHVSESTVVGRVRGLAFAGACVVLIVAGAGIYHWRDNARSTASITPITSVVSTVSSPPVPVSASSVNTASAAASGENSEYIELRITCSPPNAQIYLDDRRFNPREKLARDGLMHRFRAEARGHQGQLQMISFDAREVDLKFDLEPESSGRRTTVAPYRPPAAPLSSPSVSAPLAAAPASTPSVAPPPAPASLPDGVVRRRPPLDTADPWRK